MTEVLSQEEIDALLTAISTGDIETEAPAAGTGAPAAAEVSLGGPAVTPSPTAKAAQRHRRIKIYDFKRPDKFSKDQIRTLQMMHEAFARLATTALSARLRTLVGVHVSSVDQLTYEEFIKSIPNPTTLAVVDMSPLKGSAVLEMDPAITFSMIDRLFGGKGKPVNLNREMTDIERGVIERIILRILNDLKEAWANVVDLRPRLATFESNPQFVQIVPPNDMTVLITLETRVGEVEGLTNLCIPYITLEPIITKLSAQYWYSSIRRGKATDSLDSIKGRLARTPIPVVGVLGSTTITMRELMSLKVGDVLKLDQPITAEASVRVHNRRKFQGRVGISGRKMAIQITRLVEDLYSDEMVFKKGGKRGEAKYG
ncbi:MAG: flagellar motor switch protein FliM [Candidatus Hydrogenedentota bacterium]|nr:MAG: flagellar motor switch protein FliM [Candidatus Hydrogenedentota bacterium]